MYPWLSVPRCFENTQPFQPGCLKLSKTESRHITRVRRCMCGDPVAVLNGAGQAGMGRIRSVGREQVELELEEILSVPAASPHVTLCLGGLKQNAWLQCLKHAVELGVNRIVRIQSDHAVSEIRNEKRERKLQHWEACVCEAVKQSGNPWAPELLTAENVQEACQAVSGISRQYLAALGEGFPLFSKVFRTEAPADCSLWVGPEGDYSAEEITRILSLGAVRISLGPRVLRAETAALSLLAAIRL